MSTRQLKAIFSLRQRKEEESKREEEEEEEEEDEEEDEEERQKTRERNEKLRLLMYSSSSDDDHEEEEECTPSQQMDKEPKIVKVTVTSNKNKNRSKNKKTEDSEDWDIVLTEAVMQNATEQTTSTSSSSSQKTLLPLSVFVIDPKSFDVDAILRRRFGAKHRRGMFVGQSVARAALLHRKLLFGQPKSDWHLKPPSYIAGGIRLSVSQPIPGSDLHSYYSSPNICFKFEW
jgi:hypothetical protein